MNELIKIKEVSDKYDITARTLRYYEDMGLIASTRNDDYAYRMYDEEAVKRLEQILILRKLNISIKDIQRIFNASGSDVVLDVLGKKVQNIDDEVALLHELKNIVLDFIRQIEKIDFGSNSDVKLLYDKAKEIETHFANVDYIGKPSNITRLFEVTEKLKREPQVSIIRLPKCRMATSGYNSFQETLKFSEWWDEYFKKCKGVYYANNDFMFSEPGKGIVWWLIVENWVTTENCGGYEIFDFEGGLYAFTTGIDEDPINEKLHSDIKKWLETSGFELDERPNHRTMFNMINPTDEVLKGLGYHQAGIYVPIKLKEEKNNSTEDR